MSFPLRVLGRAGPQVSAIGYGFGSLSGFYGQAGTLDEKVALLDHAHAAGLRFWDMADVYGDSEDVVAEWIKRSGKRDDIFLTTKFALQRQPDGRHTFRSDPEYVKEACERSLKRLGVQTIDLYYCHRVDGVTPIEKTVEAMVELKKYVHLPLQLYARNGFERLDLTGKERFDISGCQKSQQPPCVGRMLSTPYPLCRWNTVCSHST